jgi:hypothetical protein
MPSMKTYSQTGFVIDSLPEVVTPEECLQLLFEAAEPPPFVSRRKQTHKNDSSKSNAEENPTIDTNNQPDDPSVHQDTAEKDCH